MMPAEARNRFDKHLIGFYLMLATAVGLFGYDMYFLFTTTEGTLTWDRILIGIVLLGGYEILLFAFAFFVRRGNTVIWILAMVLTVLRHGLSLPVALGFAFWGNVNPGLFLSGALAIGYVIGTLLAKPAAKKQQTVSTGSADIGEKEK